MKLEELTNVISPGNATNLSGGKLPNAYTDEVSKVSKEPRKKYKDVHGTDGSSGGESGGGE